MNISYTVYGAIVYCIYFFYVLFQAVVFGSYIIAHGFFSVYNMCVDTLFLCFCESIILYMSLL